MRSETEIRQRMKWLLKRISETPPSLDGYNNPVLVALVNEYLGLLWVIHEEEK